MRLFSAIFRIVPVQGSETVGPVCTRVGNPFVSLDQLYSGDLVITQSSPVILHEFGRQAGGYLSFLFAGFFIGFDILGSAEGGRGDSFVLAFLGFALRGGLDRSMESQERESK